MQDLLVSRAHTTKSIMMTSHFHNFYEIYYLCEGNMRYIINDEFFEISKNDVVLIHDDLLATGGTMLAAYHLVKKLNPKKVMINFIIELEGLKGREIFPADAEIECLLTLEGK